MYAWHQGTPNGPSQSFAVFVIHKWRAPEICQWGLLQKELYHWAMPWELSTSTPAEASLGHTREDVTPTGERWLLKLNTVRKDAFFRRDNEARGERNCICLCWKAFSPENNSRRKSPILFPFLQWTILQQVRNSLLNVINLKEKIVKNARELLVKWQARCIASPLENQQ